MQSVAASRGLIHGPRSAVLTVVSAPQSQVAESYRSIRTAIMQVVRNRECSVILVSSAMPNEGKTTTSINCAAAMAQQGSRVLLVEADMRRSKLRAELGLEGTRGLSSLIGGQTVLKSHENIIRATVVRDSSGPQDNLPIRASRIPTIWRPRQRVENTIRLRLHRYAAGVIGDALVLAPHCDVAILVARSGMTSGNPWLAPGICSAKRELEWRAST